MNKKLIIISGITGSGKTTLADKLDSPHVHFDKIYNYRTKSLKHNVIVNMFSNNQNVDTFVLDAFIFDRDKIIKLKEKLSNIVDQYEIQFLYCSLDAMYQNQRAKHAKSKGYWWKSDYDEAWTYNIYRSRRTVDNIKNLIKEDIFNNLVYVYREGNEYKYFNDDLHYKEMTK